jgi:hypothetical protein
VIWKLDSFVGSDIAQVGKMLNKDAVVLRVTYTQSNNSISSTLIDGIQNYRYFNKDW